MNKNTVRPVLERHRSLEQRHRSQPIELQLQNAAKPGTRTVRRFGMTALLAKASICGGFGREPNRELHPDKWCLDSAGLGAWRRRRWSCPRSGAGEARGGGIR